MFLSHAFISNVSKLTEEEDNDWKKKISSLQYMQDYNFIRVEIYIFPIIPGVRPRNTYRNYITRNIPHHGKCLMVSPKNLLFQV